MVYDGIMHREHSYEIYSLFSAVKWTKEDTARLATYFEEWVHMININNKGPLPGKYIGNHCLYLYFHNKILRRVVSPVPGAR
jgi:hypothetical protein